MWILMHIFLQNDKVSTFRLLLLLILFISYVGRSHQCGNIPVTVTQSEPLVLDHARSIYKTFPESMLLLPPGDQITSEWICTLVCHCLKYPRLNGFSQPPLVPIPHGIVMEILKRSLNFYNSTPSLDRIHCPSDTSRLLYPSEALESREKMPPTQQPEFAIIFGDIHGQLVDTLNILTECKIFELVPDIGLKLNPITKHVIFNGDIVDRGEMSMELLILILSIKLFAPEFVHINRGNHEERVMNRHYGYEKLITIAYEKSEAEAIFDLSQELFKSLPLATVICEQIMIVHGGLPRIHNVTLKMIEDLPRKELAIRADPASNNNTIIADMLWSDPFPDEDLDAYKNLDPQQTEKVFFLDNPNRGSIYYTRHMTDEFLKTNGLKMIVRSHETVCQGLIVHHQGRLLTLFSAPRYFGAVDNVGAVLHVDLNTSCNLELSCRAVKFVTKAGKRKNMDKCRDRKPQLRNK